MVWDRRPQRSAFANGGVLLVLVAIAALYGGALTTAGFVLAAVAGLSVTVASHLHRTAIARDTAARADALGPWTRRLPATLRAPHGAPATDDVPGWLTLRPDAAGFFPLDGGDALVWPRASVTLTSEARRLRIQQQDPLVDWTLTVGEDLATWADVRASRRPAAEPPPARVIRR